MTSSTCFTLRFYFMRKYIGNGMTQMICSNEVEKAKEKELNDLFKITLSQPKVLVGVDPKSTVCEFYKVGQCAKGFKCKFLHDLNVQRKGGKIDLYGDAHDRETMENWDQETLEKMEESKKTEYNQNKPTHIVDLLDLWNFVTLFFLVSKYFLEVIEKRDMF